MIIGTRPTSGITYAFTAMTVLLIAGTGYAASEEHIAKKVEKNRKELAFTLDQLRKTELKAWKPAANRTVKFLKDETNANFKILKTGSTEYEYTDKQPRTDDGIAELYKYVWSDSRNSPVINLDGTGTGVTRYWHRLFFDGKRWGERQPEELSVMQAKVRAAAALENIYFIAEKKEMAFSSQKTAIDKAMKLIKGGAPLPESAARKITDACAEIGSATGSTAVLTSIYMAMAELEAASEPAGKVEAAGKMIAGTLTFGQPFLK